MVRQINDQCRIKLMPLYVAEYLIRNQLENIYSPNTSTSKEHLAVKPALSVTLYCTVCWPIKNFCPDLKLLITVTSASGSMPTELSLYAGSTHVITAWSW